MKKNIAIIAILIFCLITTGFAFFKMSQSNKQNVIIANLNNKLSRIEKSNQLLRKKTKEAQIDALKAKEDNKRMSSTLKEINDSINDLATREATRAADYKKNEANNTIISKYGVSDSEKTGKPQAKPKTWSQIARFTGGEISSTSKYKTKSFKTGGGRLRITYSCKLVESLAPTDMLYSGLSFWLSTETTDVVQGTPETSIAYPYPFEIDQTGTKQEIVESWALETETGILLLEDMAAIYVKSWTVTIEEEH